MFYKEVQHATLIQKVTNDSRRHSVSTTIIICHFIHKLAFYRHRFLYLLVIKFIFPFLEFLIDLPQKMYKVDHFLVGPLHTI